MTPTDLRGLNREVKSEWPVEVTRGPPTGPPSFVSLGAAVPEFLMAPMESPGTDFYGSAVKVKPPSSHLHAHLLF